MLDLMAKIVRGCNFSSQPMQSNLISKLRIAKAWTIDISKCGQTPSLYRRGKFNLDTQKASGYLLKIL